MDPLVRLTGVAKRFPNGTLAVDHVDLAIEAGSFVTLLGPSGCGKSTVLRMIAELVRPSAGRIERPGLPEAGRNGGHPELGFVFQEPTLMPWANVADNVALPLKVAGYAKADVKKRIDEAIAMVGLEGFAHVYPRELSGGVKMRVSIARALFFGMRCSAHCFADCLDTPAECCLVLDALERNSSLKNLSMQSEIGTLTHFMLLRSMR